MFIFQRSLQKHSFCFSLNLIQDLGYKYIIKFLTIGISRSNISFCLLKGLWMSQKIVGNLVNKTEQLSSDYSRRMREKNM